MMKHINYNCCVWIRPDILKRYFVIIIMLATTGLVAQTVIHWDLNKCRGIGVIIGSRENEINGTIVNPDNCSWANNKENVSFLKFSPPGHIKVPHNNKLNFSKGFIAKIHFSCNLDSLENNKQKHTFNAGLLSKGGNYNRGYSNGSVEQCEL